MRTRMLAGVAGLFVGVGVAGASELYSVHFNATTPLYKMNQSTGAATAIGPSGFDNVGDLTSDTTLLGGPVWGIRIASNELLKFNPITGAATSVATLNSPDNITSIAFDPVSKKLYGNTTVSFGAPFDALYEIDPNTGNTTFIGRILFADVFSLGFDQGGKLFGVSDATNELISISTVTGNGALVAPLQLNFIFDIASRPEDNVMFAVDSGNSALWKLDTTTGQASLVGPYGGASPNLVGLAFSAVPEPGVASIVGVLAGGLLMRRRRV